MNAEQRFTEFVAAWERGERPDPAKAIVVASEADREPLAAMITGRLIGSRIRQKTAKRDAPSTSAASAVWWGRPRK